MVTTVSHVNVRDGADSTWDDVMQQRLEAAGSAPGWVSGQVLKPADGGSKRVIVGTWESRAAWEAWHRSPTFQATREELDALAAGPREQYWHEVTVARDR